MATFSRLLLSASTNGKPVQATASATPGTTIHTAVTGTTSYDEVYAWVTNSTAAPITLTIEWGGTTANTDHMCTSLSIPANSPPIPIVTGQVLQNGLLFRAFCSGYLQFTGYVNRIA